MSMSEALVQYEARKAQHGVPLGEGSCIATDHTGHNHKENSMSTTVKAADLKHGDHIIDPEGNEATVIRVRRVDHKRGRLETDLGVAVVALDDKFPVLP